MKPFKQLHDNVEIQQTSKYKSGLKNQAKENWKKTPWYSDYYFFKKRMKFENNPHLFILLLIVLIPVIYYLLALLGFID